MQQKQKKTSHDANKKIEKVKQRAENFYNKLSSDTSLQSIPTFSVFLEELFKIKKELDDNKQVYSWTYLLKKVDAQLSLPNYPSEYYNYFCSPIAPLYRTIFLLFLQTTKIVSKFLSNVQYFSLIFKLIL